MSSLTFPLTFPLPAIGKPSFGLTSVIPIPGGDAQERQYLSAGVSPTFDAPLQSTLVPRWSIGSPTPTFTRASTAYQQDFEGKYNLVLSGEARMQGARRVQNELTINVLNSEVFTAANNWGGVLAATADADVPAGSGITQSTKLVSSGAFQARSSSFLTVGHVYRSRYWAKGTVGGEIIWVSDGTGQFQHAITASWVLYSVKFTAANASAQVGSTSSGQTFYVTGVVIQDVTWQTNQECPEYVSAGVQAAPYHGAGVPGVQNFDALLANTTDGNKIVTEVTGAKIVAGQAGVAATAPVDANGLLGEIDSPSLQNVLGTIAAIVRTMTDAGWVNGGTLTVGAATGVDGVASAGARLTAGAVTATNTLLFTPGLGAAERTYAVPIKRITGTGPISITGDGTNYTDISSLLNTNKHATVSIDAGNVVPVVGIKMDTNLDVIDVDFNMLVAGSIAPVTPIPVNVTTAAEVTQYVSANNLGTTSSGTMQITPATALGSTVVFHFSSFVDANNYTAVLSDGTNLIARKRIGGTSHDATIAWTRTVGTVAKIGWRFDTVNGSDIFLNGAKGTNDATTSAAQIGAAFQIGADGNGANQDYCEHRFFNVYPSALPTSRLQGMTTP